MILSMYVQQAAEKGEDVVLVGHTGGLTKQSRHIRLTPALQLHYLRLLAERKQVRFRSVNCMRDRERPEWKR